MGALLELTGSFSLGRKSGYIGRSRTRGFDLTQERRLVQLKERECCCVVLWTPFLGSTPVVIGNFPSPLQIRLIYLHPRQYFYPDSSTRNSTGAVATIMTERRRDPSGSASLLRGE